MVKSGFFTEYIMKTLLSVALYLFGMILMNSAVASVISVKPEQNLQQQLDLAENGDHLILEQGLYLGNFTINKTLELSGKLGAVLDGQGKGHAIEINTKDVVIHSLKIQNWGHNLTN